jgi:hypothetical protein
MKTNSDNSEIIGLCHVGIHDPEGSACIFDLANATPTVPVSTLANPSPAMNDHFGFSVAIDDGGVWLGAPSGAANRVTLATTNVSRLYRLLQP